MSQFKVFQVLVFHQPVQVKDEAEVKPTIIKEVTTVIEKSEEMVKMKAVRELDEKWMDKLEEIVIVVRAF